ncbi:aspartic peptidase domain-containing protein [Roridomyces roridus]|uniref:Aspartic peptidase domain-containing protein n=1 Tax=Roridomyces roridus TaxID=1738132 RepID=A0AAD7FGG7_9AGAR|nr:aspartic peptidase domain-containing protein [Roridomyces roridus]
MRYKPLLYLLLGLANLLVGSATRHVALKRGKRGEAETERASWRAPYQRRGTTASSNLTVIGFADRFGQEEIYYTDVTIGTPPQHFVFKIATSFSDIWVQGIDCNPALCPSSELYNPSASSTSINQTSAQVTGQFTDAQGYIFTDTINLSTFSVANTEFFVVNTSSSPQIPGPLSGLLGLGFSAMVNTGIRVPFWEEIMETGQTEEPMFSFWLEPNGAVITSGEVPGGSLTFGGVDQSLFSGDIEYHPLSASANQWNVDITDNPSPEIIIQGQTFVVSQNQVASVLLEDHSISGPSDQISKIWNTIPGAKINATTNQFTFPCDSSLNMSISFGGRHWPINDADLNLGSTVIDNTICVSSISSSGTELWKLGVSFLKNVYTVCRQNPLAVGFAELSTLAGGKGVPNSTSSTLTSSSTSSTSSVSTQHNSTHKPNAGLIAGVAVGAIAVVLALALVATLLRRRSRKQLAIPQSGDTPLLPSTTQVDSGLVPVPFMLDQTGQQGGHHPGQKMQRAAAKLPSDSTPPAPVSVINDSVDEHAIMPQREDIPPEPTTSPPSYVAEA